MVNKERKIFLKQNEQLFWYTPKKEIENISDELLLETILNYADLITIKKLFKIMGSENVKAVFKKIKGRRKGNLYPEIHHFFSAYIKQLA